MSPLPHRPVRRRSRLTIALAVSLGLHLLLLPWIAKDAVFHLPAQVRRTAVGLVATPRSQVQHAQRGPPNSAPSAGRSSPDLSPQLPPALEQEKVKQPEKMEGQVVALGEPKDERPPDKPTKYLSEHDSRVLKETRAKETSAFFKNALSKVQREGKNEAAKPKKEAAAPSAVQMGQNGGVKPQPDRSVAKAEMPKQDHVQGLHLEKAPDGSVNDRSGRESLAGSGRALAMADPSTQRPPGQQGPEGTPGLQPGTPGKHGPLTLTLDRPGEALGPVAGGPMIDDLRGVEEGDETLLNSRSFRYAGFIPAGSHRLHLLVEGPPHPGRVHHRPEGRFEGRARDALVGRGLPRPRGARRVQARREVPQPATGPVRGGRHRHDRLRIRAHAGARLPYAPWACLPAELARAARVLNPTDGAGPEGEQAAARLLPRRKCPHRAGR